MPESIVYKNIAASGIFLPDGSLAPNARDILAAQLNPSFAPIICLFDRASADVIIDDYSLIRAIQNGAELVSTIEGAILSVQSPDCGAFRQGLLRYSGIAKCVRTATELVPSVKAGAYTPMRRPNPELISRCTVCLSDCTKAATSRQVLESVLLIKSQPEYYYNIKPIIACARLEGEEREEAEYLLTQNGAHYIDI